MSFQIAYQHARNIAAYVSIFRLSLAAILAQTELLALHVRGAAYLLPLNLAIFYNIFIFLFSNQQYIRPKTFISRYRRPCLSLGSESRSAAAMCCDVPCF